MKKLLLVPLIAVLLIMSVSTMVFAGSSNQNGTNGKSFERGTGRTTEQNEGFGYDGCQAWGGDYETFIPGEGIWLGGPCCPSNVLANTIVPVWPAVPLPNQCCNPPDFIHAQPGNHCLCFQMRF
jgi:hypothetical protein